MFVVALIQAPTFSRRHAKTHAYSNRCHSERDCHRSTTQLWNADMSTSPNHTKAFVQCCHGKHTVASSRTSLSDHVYLYSPSRPSWPVVGWTLPISFTFTNQHYCTDNSLNLRQKLRENWNSGDGFLNHENTPAHNALHVCVNLWLKTREALTEFQKNALPEMHRTVA